MATVFATEQQSDTTMISDSVEFKADSAISENLPFVNSQNVRNFYLPNNTGIHGQHKSIARANYSCINTLTVGKHHQTIHAGLALRDAQCTKWVTVDWGKICRFFRVFQVLASIVLSFSVNSPLLNDCAFFETTLVKIEKW